MMRISQPKDGQMSLCDAEKSEDARVLAYGLRAGLTKNCGSAMNLSAHDVPTCGAGGEGGA